MAKEYYFISDLHIGGDGALDRCDFEAELVAFLERIAEKDGDAELIIVGDLLGLWEFTTLSGPDKLHAIIASHIELFRQFQRTGSRMRITLIPGNHDHEVVTDPQFAAILRAYNIHLEPKEAIMRPLAGRRLWIEHGNQRDDYNRFEPFGNPSSKPFGYYVTTNLISSAGKRVRNRHEKWLKELESVYPTEYVPHWLFSNYFYREMNATIRILLAPFLLVLFASVFMVTGAALELLGVVASGRFMSSFAHSLGPAGYVLDAIFLMGGAAFITMVLLAIFLALMRHDIRRVFVRYNFDLSRAMNEKKNEDYHAAAEQVFREHPDVALFIYGHSHIPELTLADGRAIINTGAWVMRLIRVPSRFLLLPDVYCPFYQLGYFRVADENGNIAIYYHPIDKDTGEKLSRLQQLAIFGQRKDDFREIPPLTMLHNTAPEEGKDET